LRQEQSLLRMNQPRRQKDRARTLVPLAPGWIRHWWGLFLVPAVPALIAIRHVGLVYGTARAWTLLAAGSSIPVALWCLGYVRRRTRPERMLRKMCKMAKVDRMTGREFEEFCARLLWALGYWNVVITGGTRIDQGGDITAISPEGIGVVVQCKRLKTSVGPDVIRGLLGTITSGVHKGRAGMVMTNASVTDQARACASHSGITVVGRTALQAGMGLARMRLARRRVRGMHPVTLVMAAVLCAAVIAISIVADQIAAYPHPAPSAPDSSSAVRARNSPPAAPSPGSVVREYFAAISRHDWRDVWRLGGRNVGRGLSATYNGMVSGYRLTARDVVTSLSVTGDSVSVRIRAYETTGAVQAYSFRYVVRNGVIVSGHPVSPGGSR
jgi:Restriction endonuclease